MINFRNICLLLSISVVMTGSLFVVPVIAHADRPPVLSWSPVTSSGTFDYGFVPSGETVSQKFILTNSGGSASANLAMTLSGSGAFSLTSDSCNGSLGPQKSCDVTITYAPNPPFCQGQSDSATLTATSQKHATVSMTLDGNSFNGGGTTTCGL